MTVNLKLLGPDHFEFTCDHCGDQTDQDFFYSFVFIEKGLIIRKNYCGAYCLKNACFDK